MRILEKHLRRRAIMLVLVGLLLASPAPAAAQAYAGLAAGIGGADMPIGSYASGYRGTLRLYGGYAFTPYVAAEAMTLDLGTLQQANHQHDWRVRRRRRRHVSTAPLAV